MRITKLFFINKRIGYNFLLIAIICTLALFIVSSSNYISNVDATIRKIAIHLEHFDFNNIGISMNVPDKPGRNIIESSDGVIIQYSNGQTIDVKKFPAYGQTSDEFKDERDPILLNSMDETVSIGYPYIDNVPARKVTYNSETDMGTELKVEVYFVVKHNKAYQIMFMTESDDDFNLQDQVLDSIVIKGRQVVS